MKDFLKYIVDFCTIYKSVVMGWFSGFAFYFAFQNLFVGFHFLTFIVLLGFSTFFFYQGMNKKF